MRTQLITLIAIGFFSLNASAQCTEFFKNADPHLRIKFHAGAGKDFQVQSNSYIKELSPIYGASFEMSNGECRHFFGVNFGLTGGLINKDALESEFNRVQPERSELIEMTQDFNDIKYLGLSYGYQLGENKLRFKNTLSAGVSLFEKVHHQLDFYTPTHSGYDYAGTIRVDHYGGGAGIFASFESELSYEITPILSATMSVNLMHAQGKLDNRYDELDAYREVSETIKYTEHDKLSSANITLGVCLTAF